MKHVLPIVLFLTTACGGSSTQPSNSSGSQSGSGSNSGSNTFTATIDGAAWKPATITARLSSTTPAYLEVDTTDSALDLFGFAAGPFTGTFGTGTYQIGSGPSNASYVLPGGTTIWSALTGRGSGSITVAAFSAANKTASGTFNFVLVNGSGGTKTVTNGTFSVTFP
ncbi:MAG TPA: DUF6252 family protein [Vicinamibacterales bacterium]|nr:DUF6252 family protein [Vicinamibacterales bacterium]